jgi:hypothetical protein
LEEHEARRERFSKAFEEGRPIVERRSKHRKILRLLWSVYIDEDLLTKSGTLLSFDSSVEKLDKTYDWISKDFAGEKQAARRTLESNRRCAYIVRLRGRYMRSQPEGDLPDNCDGTPAKQRRSPKRGRRNRNSPR